MYEHIVYPHPDGKLENVEHCGGEPEQATNMHMSFSWIGSVYSVVYARPLPEAISTRCTVGVAPCESLACETTVSKQLAVDGQSVAAVTNKT